MARLWLKIWIDGLHVGTHLHWLLSPFSVIGLANIWSSFPADDRYSPQRKAICRMACRRRSSDLYLDGMPNADSGDPAWSAFFRQQLDERETLTSQLLDWHRDQLTSGVATPHAVLLSRSHELRAALALADYSTDDLFNMLKDTVLDIHQKRNADPLCRVVE